MKFFSPYIFLPLVLFLWRCAETTQPAADTGIDGTDAEDGRDISAEHIADTPQESLHSQIGGPCSSPDACIVPEGLEPMCLETIFSFQFPGGYCSADCLDSGTCGTNPDFECVIAETFLGWCFKKCSTDDECRVDEGYVCGDIPYVSEDTYCRPYME